MYLAHVPDLKPLTAACHAARRGPRQVHTAWTVLWSLVTVPRSRWVQVTMETPGNLPPHHSPDSLKREVTYFAHACKIHGCLRNQRNPCIASRWVGSMSQRPQDAGCRLRRTHRRHSGGQPKHLHHPATRDFACQLDSATGGPRTWP